MAVTDLMNRFFGAGFYYKTFMWPAKFWEAVYEPIIRNAAGLGALGGATNEDDYERAYAYCDLLVIGAGPTGLMAALTAARSGADVILADEDAIMEIALESGAEDVVTDSDGAVDVLTQWESVTDIRDALLGAGLTPLQAEVTMLPSTAVTLDEENAPAVMELIDMLEDLDDVQNVYHTLDLNA